MSPLGLTITVVPRREEGECTDDDSVASAGEIDPLKSHRNSRVFRKTLPAGFQLPGASQFTAPGPRDAELTKCR